MFNKNNVITHFDCSSNFLTNNGIINLIKSLEVNSTLTHVNLYDNQLNKDICNLIIEILRKNRTLVYLNLYYNRISLYKIEEINKLLKQNADNKKQKYIPNLVRSVKELEFNPNQFQDLTVKIKNKKKERDFLYKKVKEEDNIYSSVIEENQKGIIKRKLFLEVIDNLSDYYKRQHWTLYEDNAMDFVLLKYAQTYTFIEENGYIYCYNKMSSYSKRKEVYKANRTVKDVFLLAEICFDYTNNNEYEKEMAVFQLKRLLREYQKSLRLVNEGFEYYNRILNKFSECKFISNQNKRFIVLIRDILSTAEKNAKS